MHLYVWLIRGHCRSSSTVPMSFALHRQGHRKQVYDLVGRIASAEKVTVVLGAGASVEAGLPDWNGLVTQALSTASQHLFADDAISAGEWRDAVLRTETLPGALSVASSVLQDAYDALLPDWIYGPDRLTCSKVPGPILRAVAELAYVYGTSLRIATTNYDLLIEKALVEDDRITLAPYAQYGYSQKRPDGLSVCHLHGYVSEDGKEDPAHPLSTDAHYHESSRPSSWQTAYFDEALSDSTCLFLGTSLLDQDVRGFLARSDKRNGPRPAVIFVREDSLKISDSARRKFEDRLRDRWVSQGVDAFFLDYFGDVSIFLRELAFARAQPGGDRQTPYVSLFERSAQWIEAFDREVLGLDKVDDGFLRLQGSLSRDLRKVLKQCEDDIAQRYANFSLDARALSVWICTSDGKRMRRAVMSDRFQVDPSTMDNFPFHGGHQPPALLARRANRRHEKAYDPGSKTRWHYAVAVPLDIATDGGRLPVAALTLGVRCTDHLDLDACRALVDACAASLLRQSFLTQSVDRVLQ